MKIPQIGVMTGALWLGLVAVALAQPVPAGADGRFDTDFYERLLPLHRVKTAPQPYDWLAQHAEPGQSFEAYVKGNPSIPDAGHRTIYLTLLGDFDPVRRQIIEQTARFLEVYFQMPVMFIDPIPETAVPPSARRVHPGTGDRQILTRYVNENLLAARRPDDAFCLLAFTASDLWPEEGWNFVFGEAFPEERVGVWSIYRNGDPNRDEAARRLCLMRTIKTGTHEIGHMFSMYHCVFFECNMNGSNYRKESDRRPLALCPVCLRKLHWAVGFDPQRRYQDLGTLCASWGFQDEAVFYKKAAAIAAQE